MSIFTGALNHWKLHLSHHVCNPLLRWVTDASEMSGLSCTLHAVGQALTYQMINVNARKWLCKWRKAVLYTDIIASCSITAQDDLRAVAMSHSTKPNGKWATICKNCLRNSEQTKGLKFCPCVHIVLMNLLLEGGESAAPVSSHNTKHWKAPAWESEQACTHRRCQTTWKP